MQFFYRIKSDMGLGQSTSKYPNPFVFYKLFVRYTSDTKYSKQTGYNIYIGSNLGLDIQIWIKY